MDSTDFLFLDVEGSKVPFLITELVEGADLLVKFEDVDTPEAASRLTGKTVWIPTDHAEETIEDEQDDLEFGVLKGYQLIDKQAGELGVIDRVEAYPQQEIAIVKYRDKEVMVPLHADLIISIDAENQKIEMDLPEGLFE